MTINQSLRLFSAEGPVEGGGLKLTWKIKFILRMLKCFNHSMHLQEQKEIYQPKYYLRTLLSHCTTTYVNLKNCNTYPIKNSAK